MGRRRVAVGAYSRARLQIRGGIVAGVRKLTGLARRRRLGRGSIGCRGVARARVRRRRRGRLRRRVRRRAGLGCCSGAGGRRDPDRRALLRRLVELSALPPQHHQHHQQSRDDVGDHAHGKVADVHLGLAAELRDQRRRAESVALVGLQNRPRGQVQQARITAQIAAHERRPVQPLVVVTLEPLDDA